MSKIAAQFVKSPYYLSMAQSELRERIRRHYKECQPYLSLDRTLRILERSNNSKESNLPHLQLFSLLNDLNQRYYRDELTLAEKKDMRALGHKVEQIIHAEEDMQFTEHMLKIRTNIIRGRNPRVFNGGGLMSKLGWGWSNPDYEKVEDKIYAKQKEWRELKENFSKLFKDPLANYEKIMENKEKINSFSTEYN